MAFASFQKAAGLIKSADAIAIFAGAGIGVDSGLAQYRGKDGMWTKSVVVNNKAINYYDLMKPAAFRLPAVHLDVLEGREPKAFWKTHAAREAEYTARLGL